MKGDDEKDLAHWSFRNQVITLLSDNSWGSASLHPRLYAIAPLRGLATNLHQLVQSFLQSVFLIQSQTKVSATEKETRSGTSGPKRVLSTQRSTISYYLLPLRSLHPPGRPDSNRRS